MVEAGFRKEKDLNLKVRKHSIPGANEFHCFMPKLRSGPLC